MKDTGFIFRIGQHVRAVELRTGLHALDPAARELLRFIAEVQAEGEAPTVSCVISEFKLGAPPTIHSKLALLELGEWIVPARDPSDGRLKRLRLAPRAEQAFRQMSRELARLSRETSHLAD